MGDLADLSASRRVETVCPQCGTSSHVDFWEIVDVRARPELAELKTGRHFAVRCPSNHTYELNEPVIILGFASPPFVLFVPAQDTTDEEDEAAVRRLITGRREILRTIDMEDEDWFDSTSRLLLPLFITSPGVRALETAVIALLLADDAGSFGRVVGTHPVLLDDSAQEALLVLETAQRNVGDDAVADRFKALTELLSDVSREVQKSNAIQQPIIDAWERFSGSDDKSKALDAVVAAIRHALSSEDTSPNTRRSLMVQLGDALHLRHEFFSGERADLDEAIVVGEQAIALATEDEDRGSILGKLGRWLADRVELEESQSDLDAALNSLERSLSLVSKDNPDTARRHYDLGRCFGHRFRRSGASHDLDSAIENLRHAVDLTSDDNNDKAERLHALGNRLADRFKLSALQSDIDAAIAAAEDAFRIAGEDAYDTPRYVYGLGLHYSARFDAFHSTTDLEAAIDAVEKAADLTPDYRSTKPMRLVMLGVLLVDRFRQTKQLTDVAAAVRVTEDAANLAADGHLDRHTVLASLGNRYGDRYDAGKLRSDLDASIATLEESLRLTPEEYDSASGRFNNLGYRLNQRFELTGALGDLNAAVSAGERSVALTLTGDPDRPQHLNTYSTCLGDRFLQLQSRADLANALAAAEEAVALAPDSHPRKPMFLNCLSNRVAQRYGLLGLPADLDAALNACERAVQLCPEDHEYRHTYLSNLNLCLAKRFDSRRAQADLDAATAAAEQALARTPKGHEDRSLCLSNLALRRIDCFELTGARSYLDAAIALTEEAIALTPEHHVDLPGRLNNLAAWLGEKFDLTSSKGDLDTAIIAAERALVLTPGDHIDRPSRLNNLSIRLLDRFELTASRADLDAAIDAAEQAVALTAHDDIDRAMRLGNLSNCLLQRFEVTGSSEDVDAAATVAEQALAQTPAGHADRAMRLSNLGGCLAARSAHTGSRSDLDRAVSISQEAVAETPSGHIDRPSRLTNLGIRLAQRFGLTGVRADLDGAIAAGQEALDLTPEGHTERPGQLSNLALHLATRYDLTGSRSDLDTAIAFTEQAIALAPESHSSRILYLTNLGRHLAQRYALRGGRADLDMAITATEQALAITPRAHIERPRSLGSLSTYFALRFSLTGAPTDLEAAIDLAEEALALTPVTDIGRPSRMNSVGRRFYERFEHSKALADLEAAMEKVQSALALTPEGDPDRAPFLANHARYLSTRFSLTASPADLDQAIAAGREALALTPESHTDRPGYLINLGLSLCSRYQLASSEHDVDDAIRTFEQAIFLLQSLSMESEDANLIALQASNATKLLVLLLWMSGKLAPLIAALERGKVVRLRADISRAHRYPANLGPDQRDRYDGVRSRIKEIDSLLRGLDHLEPTQRPLSYNVDVSRLRKERQGLHEERLALEGGDPTFREAPLDYAGVRRLMSATNATSVYLQPIEDDEHGLLVVIVHADSPMDAPAPEDVLFVPGWHSAAVRELLFADWRQATGQDGASPSLSVPESAPIGWFTAYELWTRGAAGHADFPNVHLASLLDRIGREVMSPIARRLREVVVGRVILIPGDLLSVLPLHAAPIDEGGQPFGEAFETSYTSSATVLGHCATRPKIGTADEPSFIAIADPDSTLPFAAIEVRTVARLFPGRAKVAIGDEATWAWLARHVSAADYIALSSHAFFDLADSRMSWFQLASSHTPEADARPAGSSPPDGPRQQERWLRLDDIWANRLSLRPGSVVTAAACETGWIDFQGFPDEHLGFPTAFLAAGASTVIASLWRVDDFSTALLMQKIYRGMIVERLPPCLAAGRASAWLRKLTKNEVISLIDELRQNTEQQREVCSAGELIYAQLAELDAKRDQIVGAQDLLPFAQPSYWAGFAVYGSC